MKRKIILRVLGGLVVLIIIAVVVLALSLDKIVKKSVNTLGPEITKVSVTVDDIHIGLLTGSAKVKGLVIGNPEGYKTPNAISVGTAAVGLDVASLLSDKIIIRSVLIDAPEITFEGGLSGNNLSQIAANAAGTNQTAATTTASGKPAKKIEVDDFLLTGAKVHVSLTGLVSKEATLTLPDIHLTDLGKSEDGLTAADLTKQILSAISTATVKAVADNAGSLGNGLKTDAGKTLENATKGLGGLLNK